VIARMVIALLVVFAAGRICAQQVNSSVVNHIETMKYSPDRALVSFQMGRTGGVTLGDPFWVLDDSDQIKAGSIIFTTGSQSVGKLFRPCENILPGTTAVIVCQQFISQVRHQIPENVTIAGKIQRVSPGRRTAWLDIGRSAGLKHGDTILIRREGLPIARGRIKILDHDYSLTDLQPLVGNALPQADDTAELWPSPANQRWGRVNSSILAIKPDLEGALVTIVGTAEDGFSQGRLVDIFRGKEYIGVASIIEISDPLSVARMIETASADVPAEGDLALMRSRLNIANRPLNAYVFRIEDDYCLLTAGEVDGIHVGDKFIVRRQDPAEATIWYDIAELHVRTVKVDYAGADIHLLGDKKQALKRWDKAELKGVVAQRYLPIGIVEDVDRSHRWAVASVDAKSALKSGTIVRWVPDEDKAAGAGIVVDCANGRAAIYVPIGWGNVESLLHARIEIASTLKALIPPATMPQSLSQ